MLSEAAKAEILTIRQTATSDSGILRIFIVAPSHSLRKLKTVSDVALTMCQSGRQS